MSRNLMAKEIAQSSTPQSLQWKDRFRLLDKNLMQSIRTITREEIWRMEMGEAFSPGLEDQRSWRKCLLSWVLSEMWERVSQTMRWRRKVLGMSRKLEAVHLDSATHCLCDHECVTYPLQVSVSLSQKWNSGRFHRGQVYTLILNEIAHVHLLQSLPYRRFSINESKLCYYSVGLEKNNTGVKILPKFLAWGFG